jgi:Protein of unknown function (DUF2752)
VRHVSDLPADSPFGLRAWLPRGPVRTACGLAAATAYVAAVDPSRRSLVPPCAFHALTGWWCPGCGMTRATHHLLHGDLVAALRYNALLPFVLTSIALVWFDWYARTVGTRRVLAGRVPAWAPSVAIVVAVTFAVVRNVPEVGFLRG